MKNFQAFIDSSVLIEHLKGNPNARNLLQELITKDGEIFINDVVTSEVIFIYLKIISGKSVLTLKKKPELVKSVNKTPCYELLGLFKFLEVNEFIYRISRDLIDKYGLLPNDALILATCKFYGIRYLVSLDDDFEYPCKREGIVLIDSVEKLKEELTKYILARENKNT